MKIIKVARCINCPSLRQNEDIHFWDLYWYCARTRKFLGKTIDEVPIEIPEWCPLEDIDEQPKQHVTAYDMYVATK